MPYSVNQKVTYTSIKGKKEEGEILLRKIDFKEGYINSDHAQGGFDYLISVERNGTVEQVFCNEDDLT